MHVADGELGANGADLPDEVWEQIRTMLPNSRRRYRRGRPRMSDRQAMAAMLYRIRTGCAWKALPRSLGAASTVHDRFLEWREAAVFEKLFQAGILAQDELEAIQT